MGSPIRSPTEEEEAKCQSFPGALSRVCRVYAAGYSGMMELAVFCGVPGGVALGLGTPFKAPSRSAGIGFGPQLSLSLSLSLSLLFFSFFLEYSWWCACEERELWAEADASRPARRCERGTPP